MRHVQVNLGNIVDSIIEELSEKEKKEFLEFVIDEIGRDKSLEILDSEVDDIKKKAIEDYKYDNDIED
jgi:hypothetical protein